VGLDTGVCAHNNRNLPKKAKISTGSKV